MITMIMITITTMITTITAAIAVQQKRNVFVEHCSGVICPLVILSPLGRPWMFAKWLMHQFSRGGISCAGVHASSGGYLSFHDSFPLLSSQM